MIVLSIASLACNYHIDWPQQPVKIEAGPDARTIETYAPLSASASICQRVLHSGRVVEHRFDDNADGVIDEITARADQSDEWPHFIIILDGVPFTLVDAMYREGRFRLFAPPSRVISTFPAMTDLALARLCHTRPCKGTEALYYDRKLNRLSNGNDIYLNGENAPWREIINYHAPQNVAVGAYTNPASVFSRELREIEQLFRQTTLTTAIAYSVGTAGLGTRGGESAIRSYLLEIERLCERITFERRGRVRFSIMADHGQSLTPCTMVSFREPLEAAGFKIVDRIRDDADIVLTPYGILTSAHFHTDRAPQAAEALVKLPEVDLAFYRESDAVAVLARDGRALVRKMGSGYRYESIEGDPLQLSDIIRQLRASGHVSEHDVIADAPLFAATCHHLYPDPLRRIWLAFNGLVQEPPDLIVSLRPSACFGSKFFHFFVAPVASTHGGLDEMSSVTFLLTNAMSSPLPDCMRTEDVLANLGVPVPQADADAANAQTADERSPRADPRS